MTNSIVFIDQLAVMTETLSLPFLTNHTVRFFKTSSAVPEIVLRKATLVSIVLYQPIDLMEVLSLYNRSFPLLIATADRMMLEKMNELDYAYTLNLQQDENAIEAEIVIILAHLEEQSVKVLVNQ